MPNPLVDPRLAADGDARLVIAHRGASAHAPENTMAAFERAIAAGADALECDVRLSADGHVVVAHDATVDRMTDGVGAISRMRLDALRELNAGARWANFADRAERIPLLTEVLEAFPDVPLVIEFKSVAVAEPATALIVRHGATARVLVGGFSHGVTWAPRAAGLATVASRRESLQLLPYAMLGVRPPAQGPYRAVAIPPAWNGMLVPVARVAAVLEAPVHIWTVDDPVRAVHYWRAGITGIITNDPALMIAARNGRP